MWRFSRKGISMIKTACLKDLKKLPKASIKVIVMRHFPWWVRGIKKRYTINAPELGPTPELLKAFIEAKKKHGVKLAWIYTHYELTFIRHLNRSEKAQKTMKELKAISMEKDVYLICKEPTDEYCHRRLLKEYIEKHIYAVRGTGK